MTDTYRTMLIMLMLTIALAVASRHVDRHANLSLALTALTVVAFAMWLVMSVMTMHDWGWL